MKLKFKAAIGSLLVSGALAGAAVMPASVGAHGNTGPLCYGNVNPWGYLLMSPAGPSAGLLLGYNEAFRIKETVLIGGTDFYSLGHSASSYPADYWVYTPSLRC